MYDQQTSMHEPEPAPQSPYHLTSSLPPYVNSPPRRRPPSTSLPPDMRRSPIRLGHLAPPLHSAAFPFAARGEARLPTAPLHSTSSQILGLRLACAVRSGAGPG